MNEGKGTDNGDEGELHRDEGEQDTSAMVLTGAFDMESVQSSKERESFMSVASDTEDKTRQLPASLTAMLEENNYEVDDGKSKHSPFQVEDSEDKTVQLPASLTAMVEMHRYSECDGLPPRPVNVNARRSLSLGSRGKMRGSLGIANGGGVNMEEIDEGVEEETEEVAPFNQPKKQQQRESFMSVDMSVDMSMDQEDEDDHTRALEPSLTSMLRGLTGEEVSEGPSAAGGSVRDGSEHPDEGEKPIPRELSVVMEEDENSVVSRTSTSMLASPAPAPRESLNEAPAESSFDFGSFGALKPSTTSLPKRSSESFMASSPTSTSKPSSVLSSQPQQQQQPSDTAAATAAVDTSASSLGLRSSATPAAPASASGSTPSSPASLSISFAELMAFACPHPMKPTSAVLGCDIADSKLLRELSADLLTYATNELEGQVQHDSVSEMAKFLWDRSDQVPVLGRLQAAMRNAPEPGDETLEQNVQTLASQVEAGVSSIWQGWEMRVLQSLNKRVLEAGSKVDKALKEAFAEKLRLEELSTAASTAEEVLAAEEEKQSRAQETSKQSEAVAQAREKLAEMEQELAQMKGRRDDLKARKLASTTVLDTKKALAAQRGEIEAVAKEWQEVETKALSLRGTFDSLLGLHLWKQPVTLPTEVGVAFELPSLLGEDVTVRFPLAAGTDATVVELTRVRAPRKHLDSQPSFGPVAQELCKLLLGSKTGVLCPKGAATEALQGVQNASEIPAALAKAEWVVGRALGMFNQVVALEKVAQCRLYQDGVNLGDSECFVLEVEVPGKDNSKVALRFLVAREHAALLWPAEPEVLSPMQGGGPKLAAVKQALKGPGVLQLWPQQLGSLAQALSDLLAA
ncbi:unnamed protein product [Chrysoparadoxa australica]